MRCKPCLGSSIAASHERANNLSTWLASGGPVTMQKKIYNPVILTCQQCQKEFTREQSYHQWLQENRGFTAIFCSCHCMHVSHRKPLPDSVIDEYQQGSSLFAIGKKHNASGEAVGRYLKCAGIPLRGRGRKRM
jgi:hypothetical protein